MKRTSKRQNESGAAVVEFAVLLVLILILLAGILEFGFLWLQNIYITNAAREGARVAAKIEKPSNGSERIEAIERVQSAVKDHLKGIYPDAKVEGGCCTGDFIEVVYDPDLEIDKQAGDENSTEFRVTEVTVTVQTHQIWDPILWNFVSRENDLREISETAVFAKEDQPEPGT